MLSDEHLIVVERLNGEEVTRASLLQLAVSGVLDKKANALFKDQTKALSIVTRATRETKGPPTGDK